MRVAPAARAHGEEVGGEPPLRQQRERHREVDHLRVPAHKNKCVGTHAPSLQLQEGLSPGGLQL